MNTYIAVIVKYATTKGLAEGGTYTIKKNETAKQLIGRLIRSERREGREMDLQSIRLEFGELSQ